MKVWHAYLASGLAVERILLNDAACVGVSVINVVTVAQYEAAAHHRPFASKSRIGPVAVEVDDFVDTYPVGDAAEASVGPRAGADNIIAQLGVLPNFGLARRERADSMKRVRGKP